MRRKIEALIQTTGGWARFRDPTRTIHARYPNEVRGVLAEVDRQTRETGQYAVGFVSYEAGAAFNLAVHPAGETDTLPLVWFALFEPGQMERLPFLPVERDSYALGTLSASVDRATFEEAFRRIKTCLADGDTYQVNYTFRLDAPFQGSAHSLFVDLTRSQGGCHSAFIDLGTHAICSASPELFFDRTGTLLSARPMKGTRARGLTLEADRAQAERLQSSAKDLAENVMIVDMVRNDLGRIADVGSVSVPELFTVERYPAMWQMTSLVTARSLAALPDLFAALHPSASVTGAPKVRTMAILRELECGPRGVYTGAIGLVEPGGDCHFNVAIRTAVVDNRLQRVQFGIGSGIVWDSDAAEEYRECLLKGSVLGHRPADFELLETLRWTPEDGFFLLERHLLRMRESAEYFGFPYDEVAVLASLQAAAVSRTTVDVGGTTGLRVRLLLARDGTVRAEQRPLVTPRTPAIVRLAAGPIDQDHRFLYHKTTNRGVYEQSRNTHSFEDVKDVDEVILWNASGLVTEATTANVVVEVNGERLTPPVECGLLGGTFRAEALAKGEIREAVVTVEQLKHAVRIWLINSVHGWREAVLREGRLC